MTKEKLHGEQGMQHQFLMIMWICGMEKLLEQKRFNRFHHMYQKEMQFNY